jgi:hypothetical protein
MLMQGYARARRTRPRKGNVDLRLFELERLYEATIAKAQALADEETAADMRDMIRAYLVVCGVEQQRSESLFDAFARALEMSSMELRAHFMQRAMGATTVR